MPAGRSRSGRGAAAPVPRTAGATRRSAPNRSSAPSRRSSRRTAQRSIRAEVEETERVEPHDVVPSPVEEAGDANPLAHAAPNVELADEQARFGTVEDEEFEHEEELVQEDLAEQAEEERERALPAVSGERGGVGHRLVGFLQGSWRELQRVQWPDRRQVAQATGVVLGFVIIAGAFLGLSDLVASKLVNYILK